MANPSPAAIAAIKAKVPSLAGGWTGTDAAIASSLNTTMVANPAPQATVPKAFATSTVVGLISPASLAKILSLPSFESAIRPMLDLVDPKDAGSIAQLNRWAAGLFRAGMLTQAEFDALAAPTPGTTTGAPVGTFNQTQLDPSWPAQVGWGVATLGRPADANDVAIARVS